MEGWIGVGGGKQIRGVLYEGECRGHFPTCVPHVCVDDQASEWLHLRCRTRWGSKRLGEALMAVLDSHAYSYVRLSVAVAVRAGDGVKGCQSQPVHFVAAKGVWMLLHGPRCPAGPYNGQVGRFNRHLRGILPGAPARDIRGRFGA